ncbi:MAG: SycD/LcrH family type III secretion system chaperone [Deltaproteobacteria bacterium]|nr:SycD/LcrH family type III secretion system chaperone [Deltaproteobacteria bacterium]
MSEEMNTAEMNKEELDAFLKGVFAGLPLGEAAGVKPETIEAGYGLAFSLYNSGNFKDAETMFQALCLYNHQDERFWMGLGGCRQVNGDLDGAIDAYGMATFTGNLANPGPSVHAGLCYLKKGDKENARALFDAAIELGDSKSKDHQAYHERARAMLDLLKKEVSL